MEMVREVGVCSIRYARGRSPILGGRSGVNLY